MSLTFKKTMNYIKVCLNCGCFDIGPGLHCEPCSTKLRDWESATVHFMGEIPTWSLYDWESRNSEMLSRLIMALKNGNNRGAWSHLANMFINNHVKYITQLSKAIIFVPAPSRQKIKQDHAYLWCKSLQEGMGGAFWPGLQRLSDQHQRGSGRAERALMRFSVDEKLTWPPMGASEKLWVFVDDIFTTGATARAAYDCLGRPKNFMVWALARRKLACDETLDLL